jgi:hypothetical protein
MKTRLLLLAALTAAPAISVAQTASAPADPAALVVCADEKDDAARLACYDWQAARQRAAAKAAAQAANGAGKATAPAASAAPAAAATHAATSAVTAPAPSIPAPAPVAHTAPPPMPATVPPAPAVAPASGSASASAANDSNDPNYGLQGSQLRKAQGRENAPKPPKLQPLVAAVSSVKQYTASEVRVTLNNGQVWEQAESRTGFWLEPGQTVTITPGVLGSFFLTDDQHQRVRVKRIL